MPNRRYALAALAAPLAALTLPRIALAQTANPVVRIAATANDTFAEAYYARDGGFFKRANIDIDLSTFPNGGAVMSAVGGNAVDVGISTPVQLAVAVQHGLPLTILAPGAVYSAEAPTTLLCVAKTSGLRDPRELEGQTIALSTLTDISSVGLSAWLDAHNVDRTKVKTIELPFSQMAAALNRGTVAAAIISEPSLTAARGEIKHFAPLLDAIGPHFLFSVWYTSTDWRTKNPALAQRLIATFAAAARWANTHHAETAATLATEAKLLPATLQGMTRTNFAETLDPRLLQPALDLAYKYKKLERPMTAASLIAEHA